MKKTLAGTILGLAAITFILFLFVLVKPVMKFSSTDRGITLFDNSWNHMDFALKERRTYIIWLSAVGAIIVIFASVLLFFVLANGNISGLIIGIVLVVLSTVMAVMAIAFHFDLNDADWVYEHTQSI